VLNLSGGSREHKTMTLNLGNEHLIEPFQNTIPKIFDPQTRDANVIERERFWKFALASRGHGMNHN
jgi:hypothetical protein